MPHRSTRRRLGQAERHDSLAARNSRLAPGDLLSMQDPAVGGSNGRPDLSGLPGAVPEVDARARCAELDRRERGNRPRLSLVLRLEDVRHMRGPHERPRGAGVLGSGRAEHDHRAAAQSSGHSRPRRRSHAATRARSQAWSRGSSAASPTPDFPSRSLTSR